MSKAQKLLNIIESDQKFKEGDKLILNKKDYEELKKHSSPDDAGYTIYSNTKLTKDTIYTFKYFDGSNAVVTFDKELVSTRFGNNELRVNANRFTKI